MPKTYKRYKRHALSPKKRARLSRRTLYALYSCAVLILALLVIGWWSARTENDTRYEVMGAPSISADFINQVLDRYGSPAHGKGQALYDLGVKYGVDPVYALAFFMHESRFGTTGVAQMTLSLGNIRATDGYTSYNGYRQYRSWEEGFEDWYKLIKVQYVQTWQLSTVDQIIPVYAPSSDNNDVKAYIQAIKDAVTAWRSGKVQV